MMIFISSLRVYCVNYGHCHIIAHNIIHIVNDYGLTRINAMQKKSILYSIPVFPDGICASMTDVTKYMSLVAL